MMTDLDQTQAINILIQAARIAQQRGAFTLEDAEMVAKSIKVLSPQEPVLDSSDESE